MACVVRLRLHSIIVSWLGSTNLPVDCFPVQWWPRGRQSLVWPPSTCCVARLSGSLGPRHRASLDWTHVRSTVLLEEALVFSVTSASVGALEPRSLGALESPAPCHATRVLLEAVGDWSPKRCDIRLPRLSSVGSSLFSNSRRRVSFASWNPIQLEALFSIRRRRSRFQKEIARQKPKIQ